MLSDEQEKILSYNGEVLIFQLSKAKCAAEKTRLHVKRMVYDSGTNVFVQKSSGLLSMHGGSLNIEIVSCSCAADFRTGVNLPCILMRRKKNNSVFKYFLLLFHSSNEFEQCLHFKLDYELKDDIRLLNGPTVLWRHAKRLFYISTKTCTVLSASVQFSSIEWADEVENEGIVVIGIRAVCLSEEKDRHPLSKSDGAIWGSEFVVYAIENQKILSGICFLPHAYSSVISSVHVCRINISRSPFRTSVVAITRKKQLIWFQDGLPKDVCQLPYEEPCSIQVAETGINGSLFVVSFASGNVCAVHNDSFQVTSRWQEAMSVLIDDFIGTGTEQILLLFKDISNTDSLSKFIITDSGKVSYASDIKCKEVFPPAEGLQENGFLTIQALEARLQAGYASVRELQHHLRLKEKVLFESCRALIDLVHEREHILPTAEEEGLVSLWDDTENLHPLDKKMTLTSEIPEHFIEKLWHRVVDDRLVVGIKIRESPNLSLNDVRLSLVMRHDFTSISPVIECQSKLVKLNQAFSAMSTSSCQMEQRPKRIKLDFCSKNGLKKEYHGRPSEIPADGAKTFVAVTHLSPLLAFRDVCCIILLHAKRRKYQDGNLQESKKLNLSCGKISFCLEDISSGKYSVNLLKNNSHCTGAMEDIFAILAVSLKFSFQIVSPDCTLTTVKLWLLSQMECVPVKECPENMFCHKFGSPHGTVFSWNPKTPFKGILTLFCSAFTDSLDFFH
ncbi:Fanconi anemia group B protein isoform X2 [Carettochelys insculpta]|uniref:Fanconi anemia group B protein isoform X2 n=1 Tax=Carettochelys insculpta TaxID=44489 RepID=UPI003EBDD332